MKTDKRALEAIYRRFNRKEFIHPDPLEFVYRYRSRADREAAGFIAAALAYGNVTQILKSAGKVLALMGPSPAGWLRKTPVKKIAAACLGFKHRFTGAAEMALFLANMKTAYEKYGSLEHAFSRHYRPGDETLAETLYAFVNDLNSRGCAPTLTPCPELKSSFKRLNLFLRWMVRKDEVDPGVWTRIPPAKLIIPLDTHMFQAAGRLGLTRRHDTSMRTALEITAGFRRFSPDDPVRYDFALTRAGILKNNTRA
jgi:uncharacterized protein (TIGR02757 family)